jgi:hypothetical protein
MVMFSAAGAMLNQVRVIGFHELLEKARINKSRGFIASDMD